MYRLYCNWENSKRVETEVLRERAKIRYGEYFAFYSTYTGSHDSERLFLFFAVIVRDTLWLKYLNCIDDLSSMFNPGQSTNTFKLTSKK